jgi:competence protein ComEC
MRKFITLAAVAAAAFFATAAASSGPYFGSSKSNVYHLGSCRSVKQITTAHLISFSTKEDAKKKGYRPCLVCKP